MKKAMIILAAILMGGSHVNAQEVLENEAAVVYYMPKNELAITLEYDVVTQQPGKFYQYAERYLGTKNVITETKSTHILAQVTTCLNSVADTKRGYKVVASAGVKDQLITLSQDGRLLGYNVGTIEEIEDNEVKSNEVKSNDTKCNDLMPLLEEQFMASSIAKMAEGAAKQIYRIRETRLNLLAGEVENVPADGKAMELVLAELQKQEAALTELFVGKISTEHKTHTLAYTPQESVDKAVICRFSIHTGVVDADDLSGEPIYLNLEATKQNLQINMEPNAKTPALSQLYYNLPGQAQLAIEYKGQTMAQAAYQIAQFGVAIPLTKQLFTAKITPIIYFNPATGNILSIQ